ncbi:MAG: 3-phosphoshikimate 1-carboxyvinyltransferase [Clostridiales bacterium]|nr:3-phosphoshikimate 1-carboxyvinyltransferase [Clostridiales bacterium]
MNVTITPGKLQGTLAVPPSKSQAHRLLIAAALADGESHLTHVAMSQDIAATLGALQALGASCAADGTRICGIRRGPWKGALPHLDCGESGSTLRFMIPIALAVAGGGVFTGRGRLMQRPQAPYFELFRQKGIDYTLQDGVLTVRGCLRPGDYALRGDVSSQFFTGLLFALSLLEGPSSLASTTALESADYLAMTLQVLQMAGITVAQPDSTHFAIAGAQPYRPIHAAVEGDYSQAAFYLAANGMGSQIQLTGLSADCVQADRIILQYAQRLRAPGAVELDVRQCPDLVPALAVQAALRAGQTTRIVNAARLRMKESDRLQAVSQSLNALGARVQELPDALQITGVAQLQGGAAESFHDHRIAMMLAVAATCAAEPVVVQGAECVQKSYPNFWEDYEALGGVIRREGRQTCSM